MNTLPTLVATGEPARLARVPRRWHWIGVALLLAAGLFLAACSANPRVFGFQGRLTDSAGSPVTATKNMTFRLWTASTNGTNVFTETQSVAVTNGLFNVFIGNSTTNGEYGRSGVDPENFSASLWVEVEVDGETLSPRTRLGSAPTSMGLVGGAVVVSDHEGNGNNGGGADSTTSSYASLSVIASSQLSGTALLVGHAAGNTGDLIRVCINITDTTTRTCPNRIFRVQADGDVSADGAFIPGGADYAEMFASSAKVGPGDVLAIGPDGRLVKSTEANQATVVGVYSTKPGFVANGTKADTEGYVPVALMGVVPVKVTGAVKAGDMLVASSVPGHAMRGGSNPAAGTVIGKALQASKTSYGIVLMLVMSR